MKQSLQQQFCTGKIIFQINQDNSKSFEIAQIEPIIIKKQSIFLQQRREMLNKYRKFVQNHSSKCDFYNKEVIEYNAKVISFLHQNNLQADADKATQSFKNKVGKVSVLEYNEAAKIENTTLAKPLIQLKKHTPIKKAIEHTFSVLCFKYAMQIDEKNKLLEGCGATTLRALQKIKINHHELVNTKIDDVFVLPYTKRTIQNHIQRLRDAGVLFEYTFKGHNKPVEYHVNSQILSVFDLSTRKSLNTENELFKYQSEKNFHNNVIDTRTYLNKIEIIENVNNHSQGKETFATLISKMQLSKDNKFYKNTSQAKPEKNKTDTLGAEKINKLSEFLYEKIKDTSDFMLNLKKGVYDKHRFTHRNHFEAEVYSGNLIREDFRELLLQEFLKITASIWKNTTPSIASWRKAWNIINETLIINPNNSIPSKTVQMYMFDNLVFRITFAKRFFNKFQDYNPLYPSQYFDPTRKDSKSGGFAYTLNILKKHQKAQENRAKQKQKCKAEAAKRNLKNTAIELVERKINALKNGKINLNDLHDYVSNNKHIPLDIKQKLPLYIQRIYKD